MSAAVVTRDNWKSIDVLANMDSQRCFDAIREVELEVDGQTLYQFTSHEDDCDGAQVAIEMHILGNRPRCGED